LEKLEEKELLEEYRKLKDEKTKEALRKQLEKRRVELGVGGRSN